MEIHVNKQHPYMLLLVPVRATVNRCQAESVRGSANKVQMQVTA